MKNIVKLFGVIALVAVIGFSMAGCPSPTGSGGGGGGSPAAQKAMYGGIAANGDAYLLEITEKVSRYTAKTGDTYVLTFIPASGDRKSKTGTIKTFDNGQITLEDTASATFTVTITEQGITQISGTITWEDEATTVLTDVTFTPPENKDFLISNGVLLKYLGAGGKVTIPNIRKTARFT